MICIHISDGVLVPVGSGVPKASVVSFNSQALVEATTVQNAIELVWNSIADSVPGWISRRDPRLN